MLASLSATMFSSLSVCSMEQLVDSSMNLQSFKRVLYGCSYCDQHSRCCVVVALLQ
ncbi:hypothetical protein U1Q18_049908, partial [Sarracenia purpurea var. burkii]